MNSKDNSLLSKKTKRPSSFSKKSHDSKGSEDFVFTNRSNSAFIIRHCSNYKEFEDYLSKVKNPYYTTDTKFLKNSGIIDALNNKDNLDKEIKLSTPIEKIDKTKIFPINLPRNFFQNNDKKKTGNFIFSNIFRNIYLATST